MRHAASRICRTGPMTDTTMQDAKRLHMAGRIADAAGLYRKILSSNPRHIEALYGLAMTHAQNGQLREGEQYLAEALKFSPAFAEGWRARGVMLMHLGKRAEARASLDQALALKPDFEEARAARANLLREMDEPQIRLLALERALAQSPHNAAAWNDRGTLLVSMGRKDEALVSF